MKLTNELRINLTQEEKQQLQLLADELELSLNTLVRAMLNSTHDYIRYVGVDKCFYSIGNLIITDAIKK